MENQVKSKDELSNYVMLFYAGDNPTWDWFTSNPITIEEVELAVYYHRNVVCKTLFNHNGYCNTQDREVVRDILLLQKQMVGPKESVKSLEYQWILSKFFTPKGKLKRKYERIYKHISLYGEI